MSSIEWQTNLGYVEDSAVSVRKPILFYYHDEECIGCRELEEQTFSDGKVISFIMESVIPMKMDIGKKAFYEKYNVIWTPTLLILDYTGNEIQRSIGFLDSDELIATMHLGIAKVHFITGEFDAANVHLKRLLNQFQESTLIAEAIYFQGVNLYKQKGDTAPLKHAHELLVSNHPLSSWTKRSVPYQSL